MTRRAFTLIEVMAVVALIGLLAAATAWSLAGDAQRASHADVIDRLIHADRSARFAAKRLGPSTLHIDLDTQRARVVSTAPGRDVLNTGQHVQLPPGHRIDQVIWIDHERALSRGAREHERVTREDGEVTIPVGPDGMTRTYALVITGPQIDPGPSPTPLHDTATTWLVFSGLTGQATEYDDEASIDNLFMLLAQARADAD